MVTSSTFWSVCAFILVTELCERFAFYGLTGSLTLFLQTLCIDSVTPADDQSNTKGRPLAAELSSLFSSLVYVTPVVGAYVADAHWGRYSTILFFCAIYLLGLIMTTASAWPTEPCSPEAAAPSEGSGIWLMPRPLALSLSTAGLFVGVAVGAGGIKANVVVLGADQFEIPRQAAEQDSFFRWFYWSINIGATVSFTYVAWLAVHGQPGLIPRSLPHLPRPLTPLPPSPTCGTAANTTHSDP